MAFAEPLGPQRVDAEAECLALLLPQLSRFLRTKVDGYAIDRDGAVPDSVRSGLARLGLFGMTIPTEYGGAGLSLGAACRVVAEVARVDRSLAVMVGLHVGLGTRGIVELGSPSLQARWLPRLAAGDCIASFGATEPGAGSALASVQTIGRHSDGDIVIDGEKSYVTNGGLAALFTLLVRTPGLGGDRGYSLVCVPADAAGLSRSGEEDKLGIRGSSTVTVSLQGVRVGADHVLGIGGQGLVHAQGLLAWGRTLMSAGCVGAARGALDATLSHVRQRRQFGSPIGEFGSARAHVAWMASRVHAMEALVRHVADAESAGEVIDIDSMLAKVFCSEGAFEVCDRAVQLHGALGFLESTGVPRILRDTRVTRIFEGANDVLLLRIGAALLGEPPREGPGRRRGFSAGAGAEVQQLEDLDRWLAHAVDEIRERWGVAAVRHQVLLQRLARAAMCARAARACVEQPHGDDGADRVAAHAARTLAEEGADWLQRLELAEADEEAEATLTDHIYAR
jgi:alkylation response protein AidB-like acyl-CoA dehydrogenase